jgi:hypothetical protein
MSEDAATRQMLDGAERAATGGDFSVAYDLLRGALRRQEQVLGAAHPDLANTLNNLAVVAERTGREKEAEPLYRRAAAIAEAAFPPDHPMVVASRQNLEDFCRARGLSLDAPASEGATRPALDTVVAQTPDIVVAPAPDTTVMAAPHKLPLQLDAPVPQHPSQAATSAAVERDINSGDAAPASPRATPLAADRTRLATSSEPLRPAPSSTRGPRPLVWLAVAAGIIVVAVLLLLRPGSSRDASTAQLAPGAVQPDAADPQPPSATQRGTPAPSSEGRRAPAVPTTRKDGNGSARTPAPAGAVTIVTAEVCRTLSTSGRSWRCEPIGDSVAAGRVVFYTRLRSARNAAVMHRWYRGGTLQRSVRLTTRANANEGYRTYSRQTVDKGDWRVELTSADGDVLHEKRFVVR